jgi:hypothetical protein
MPIETVSKRKSVINDCIPGLALLPYPDGSIQAPDRRRVADFYSLGTQVVAHNFWVPDRRENIVAAWAGDKRVSEPSWKQDQDATENFVKDERTSTTWKQDDDADSAGWLEDTEVPV